MLEVSVGQDWVYLVAGLTKPGVGLLRTG